MGGQGKGWGAPSALSKNSAVQHPGLSPLSPSLWCPWEAWAEVEDWAMAEVMGVVGGGLTPEYSSLEKGAPGASPWAIVSCLVPVSLPRDHLYPQLLLHEIIIGRLFHATEQGV